MTSTQPTIELRAALDPSNTGPDWAGSWFITHGNGKPAQNTYTEVAFGDNARIDPQGQPWPEHILDAAVREVAGQLYGRAWAFHYRPDEAPDAIHRWGLRRRERVIVTSLECWA